MSHFRSSTSPSFLSPGHSPSKSFDNAESAVNYLINIYDLHTRFLQDKYREFLDNGTLAYRVRATYPEIRLTNDAYVNTRTPMSYGHVVQPGDYTTTITRPALFRRYLIDQLSLLLKNHNVPIVVGESAIPIPLHFALNPDAEQNSLAGADAGNLRDFFDVPDIAHVNDYIVNGTYEADEDTPLPLAPFPAQRIDYSLHRLVHYTQTAPEHFQNFVLFTNYQFYVDEFCRYARELMSESSPTHTEFSAFVEPGNLMTPAGHSEPVSGQTLPRVPQMPAYHLVGPDNNGITLVNIGVGPSNAKTITDHVAVLRPHAWLMLGHCAGLRNGQRLGDYVLAHAYVREDHVLDNDIPVWVPIPALAEIQQALESAVADITGHSGLELKEIMRTGTVASVDNRNWELQDMREPVRRLSQSRAIALDMESATIAANGFRLRVPYGTLLCVSDKPLQGELKLPGMASEFYREQVGQHLQIGIEALKKLRDMKLENLHSRKLRSFYETAFQ